jgi:hypothetical protein
MDFDLSGIRTRLRLRLEWFCLRTALGLLHLIMPIIVKLGTREPRQQVFDALAIIGQTFENRYKSFDRYELFSCVGQALTRWAQMEDLLIAIVSLLLRVHEGKKIGTILYSITNFYTWLSIIGDLFSLEPLYVSLKPRWNKISHRLKGLNDTRVRLAHHSISLQDNEDTSLRPGQFDSRPKSHQHRVNPLDYDQIIAFMESVSNITEDIRELLNAMTDLLKQETSQQKSPPPVSDQHHP